MSATYKTKQCGLILLAAALVLGVPWNTARAGVDSGERSFALRAKVVLPVSKGLPWRIESCVIVVRDGKVEAIGSDVVPPSDLPMIEFRDATIIPGLVAVAGRMVQDHTGDESVAAGYRAIDAFDSYANYAANLAGGVTTVHLSPGEHRLLTGQGAVVKLGGPRGDRVLSEQSDLTIHLGEKAFQPPRDVNYNVPSSSDVAIPPAVRQRPNSRLGQFLALEEVLIEAIKGQTSEKPFVHARAFALAWGEKRTLRMSAQRAADLRGAIRFLSKHDRPAYVVGGAEADIVADELRASKIPLVYRLQGGLRNQPDYVGYDPDALDVDIAALNKLDGVKLALAVGEGQSIADLRLSAATAVRTNLSEQQVMESITRTPAEILGVAGRVGSLAPGFDADFVVLSGGPLDVSSHVLQVFIGGEVAFQAPKNGALVVRGGTIWVDDQKQFRDGAVLIEDGKISAVGHTVPHPPFARVIDAGPNSFVSPGLIDAFGHLGLDGDVKATAPELTLARIIGVPDVIEHRVARAGITSIILSPYSASGLGSQVTAVKTAGADREDRVVRDTAGVVFQLGDADPIKVKEKLTKRLKAGKKYLEKWQKYEKELAEWKEKKEKGEAVNGKAEESNGEEVEAESDPITGTWAVTISGGPIPEPQTATLRLKLEGSDVEGRIAIPGVPEEAKVTGTFDGEHFSGEFEVDTPFGYPAIEADLVEEDHLVGVISIEDIEIDLDAKRTDKAAVEFKVVKRKNRGKDGRPLPPKVEEALEPMRAVLLKTIPMIVGVASAPQIAAVLEIVEEYDVELVLRGGDDSSSHIDKLKERSVGVIVPKEVVRLRKNRWYHQADDLARQGIAIAFQSDADDEARGLPLRALYAVERGLSADSALAAFTTWASRMFKLDDRIGSLNVGRDGDIVIFSGHPFKANSRVQRVIVNGEDVR